MRELAADGVFPGPKCFCGQRRDHGIIAAILIVVEKMPFDQRQMKRLKISGADPAPMLRRHLEKGTRVARNARHVDPEIAIQRKYADNCSILDSRQGAQIRQHFCVEVDAMGRLFGRQVDGRRQYAIQSESRAGRASGGRGWRSTILSSGQG